MRDKMIRRWEATGLPTEARLREALQEIARLNEKMLRLQQRVHNQRMALRRNWEIVEQRAEYKALPHGVRSRFLRGWATAERKLSALKAHVGGNGQDTP